MKKQEYKETRYKCIIMLMHGVLDFERSKKELLKYGYGVNDLDDLIAVLNAEHINAFLYASDDFLYALADFIAVSDDENLRRTTLAIRKVLWGVKTKLSLKNFKQLPNNSIKRKPDSQA